MTRVVVDADAVHLTDTDGADIVLQVAEELADDGIGLTFAAVHPPVLALWARAGVLDAIGADSVKDTLDEAIFATDGRPAARPIAAARRTRPAAPSWVAFHTARLTGNVAIQITVPRKITPASTTMTARMRSTRSLLPNPAKNRAIAKRTTART